MVKRCTVMIVHIPKAAGTTLRWIMDRQYPQELIWKIKSDIVGDQQELEKLPDVEKGKLRAVFGHYCYGLHAALAPNQPFEYATILRDPVKRLVSLYAYAKVGIGHYLQAAVQKMSFADFVTSGVTQTADNAQVRQLCGVDRFTMRDGKQQPYDDMVIPFGQVTREHLEMAKRNLGTFACVGVAEQFNRFLACMQEKFGWRIGYYDNQNITRYKPKVDQQSLDIAREHSILDYELYEYARKLALGEQQT